MQTAICSKMKNKPKNVDAESEYARVDNILIVVDEIKKEMNRINDPIIEYLLGIVSLELKKLEKTNINME